MWILAWIYNGKVCEEWYDSYPDAFSRMIQLEAYNFKVSLHAKL